jgi:serine protease AprX
VSIKAAEPDGSTDVSVVIDGLQWAYTNRLAYNIKVLSLSFGTDAVQSYLLDPLDFAVEQVWNAGITVVVSAGNRGPLVGTITKPGDDPFVITVGAADNGTRVGQRDDTLAAFSSVGPTQDLVAKPDLLGPGVGMVSLRCPGCTVDLEHPEARIGDDYFKGTGTSQATAVVSGVVALMYEANPTLTPNQAKAVLVSTARDMPNMFGAGAGLVDAYNATVKASMNRAANRGVVSSTGLGPLEGSRGTSHAFADLNGDGITETVLGEIGWSGSSWGGTSWGGIAWGGSAWGGSSWGGSSWGGSAWGGSTWGGSSWGSEDWS